MERNTTDIVSSGTVTDRQMLDWELDGGNTRQPSQILLLNKLVKMCSVFVSCVTSRASEAVRVIVFRCVIVFRFRRDLLLLRRVFS